MTIVTSGVLESYTPSVSTQADQNIINQKVADNIESLRRFGIGIGDVTSLHSHTTITSDNFTLYKKAGFISFYQFNSSTGNIDGVFDSATLQEGDQFLLVNKASTPSTNTVTLALGSYSLLGSGDTSIILNSNSVYIYLVYIGSDKFIRVTHNTDILEQANIWTGSNSFPNLTLTDTITAIGTDTVDHSDNKVLIIKPNSGTHSTFRGGYMYVAGNEFAGENGNVGLVSGSGSILFVPGGTAAGKFNTSGNFELLTSMKFNANNAYTIADATNAPSDIYSVNALTVTSDMNKKRDINDLDISNDFIIKLSKKAKKFKWKDFEIPESKSTQKVLKTEKKKIKDIQEVTEKGKLIRKELDKEIDSPIFKEIPIYNEKNIIIDYKKEYEYEYIDKIKPKQDIKHKRFHFGFLAQDIEDLFKELGYEKKDYPGLLVIDENNNYALRQDQLIPIIIKSLGSCIEQIEELKQEIKALKNA